MIRPRHLTLFPSVLADGGGWPGARLVLFGADETLARSLGALRVSRAVPLAPDETTAHRLIEHRPPTVARHTDLERPQSPLRRARHFVRAACTDWHLDTLRDDAIIVANELHHRGQRATRKRRAARRYTMPVDAPV